MEDTRKHEVKKPLVPYATIPGVKMPVSRLLCGTAFAPMVMGGDANELLDSILELGVNFFDCARGYGKAEISLGNWIKASDVREKIVLLTKCGNINAKGEVHIDSGVIDSELDASLQSLQTDYIDVYLLHRDDPKTPVGEIVDCLNKHKKEGKIRIFGVSNWTHQRIEEANAYAREHGLEGFSVSSPNFGLAEQVEDPWGGDCVSISGPSKMEARKWYEATQMPVLAYSSLGRGFFSGVFKSGDYETAKKMMDPYAQRGYLHECNMERLKRAEKLATEKGCSVPQIAMRYIFSSEMNVFAIVSTPVKTQMEDNIQATLHPLTKEEAHWLEYGD